MRPASPQPRSTRSATDDRHVVAVLWDLDGTLVGAEPLRRDIERDVLAARGVRVPEARARAWSAVGSRVVLEALLDEAGRVDEVEAALAEVRVLARERVVERAVPLRGAEDILRDIPMRTHRFGLVTPSRREVAEALLGRFGWSWRFEAVVVAEEVAACAPAPDAWLLACERLGVAPRRALVVTHAPLGVLAGKAAGCRVAAVPGPFAPAELGDADFVLSNLGAVVGLLGVLG